jgi:pilus assembly protein CpaB
MERRKLILVGAIALALATFVSFGIFNILKRAVLSGKDDGTAVVVAALDLNVGSQLQEKDLRLVKLPPGDLPTGVFHRTSEVVGRGVLIPMSRNEPVLESKIAAENGGAGLPSMIQNGMRAVSVKVNDVVAVAGFVIPGTRVDVLLTGTPTRDGELTTTTVLENVQVLAAGQKLQRDANGEPQQVPVITLLVSPEDAQKLTLANQDGKIQLSLRNPLDNQEQQPDSVKNAALYHLPSAPAAPARRAAKKPEPPPPSSVYMVEMIRGDKRDEVKF